MLIDVTLFHIFSLPQHPIHNWEGSPQEILLRNYAHHLKSIDKWLNKNISEQVDCIGQNERIIADENYPVFKHHQSKHIDKGLHIEHGKY